jgi:dephospho-CoA kinase
LLVERGAVLVDADAIAREVVEPGTPAWSKIVEHFGAEVLLADKQIDRAALGEIAFNDRTKLALLNEIQHPEIMRRIADRLEELKDTEHVVVADVPLLIEVGATDMFDLIVVVTAASDVQLDRMKRLRGLEEGAARARLDSQLPIEDKALLADRVIVNDGSMDELVAQIDRLWTDLEGIRGGRPSQ